jgi:histidinol-phosphate phosphatase family protein
MIDFSQVDKSWSLFLDRDGVINVRKKGGYVTKKEEFVFLANVKGAIAGMCRLFARVVICTNQQGISKGLYTPEDLHNVHNYMLDEIGVYGGFIDGIYFAPELASDLNNTRKPKPDMALQAQKDFPDIDFSKSIMVGDTNSDILFGKNLGMKTILITSDELVTEEPDLVLDNLWELATIMTEK